MLTIAEALGTKFTYNGNSKTGILLNNSQLQYFANNGSPAEVEAANLLLQKTEAPSAPGANRTVKLEEPFLPIEDIDGHDPVSDVPEEHSAPESALVVQNNGVQAVSKTGLAFMDPADIPDLDECEEGANLNRVYKEFTQPGQTERAIFCGFSTMPSQNGEELVPVAVFQNKHEVWGNGGASLVQQLEKIPQGTPVQVKFVGEEKTKKNFKVKKFEVRLLNFKK